MLPSIGAMPLTAVRPKHARDIVDRFGTGAAGKISWAL